MLTEKLVKLKPKFVFTSMREKNLDSYPTYSFLVTRDDSVKMIFKRLGFVEVDQEVIRKKPESSLVGKDKWVNQSLFSDGSFSVSQRFGSQFRSQSQVQKPTPKSQQKSKLSESTRLHSKDLSHIVRRCNQNLDLQILTIFQSEHESLKKEFEGQMSATQQYQTELEEVESLDQCPDYQSIAKYQ